MKSEPEERRLTLKEAAKESGIHGRSISNAIKKRWLPATFTDGNWTFTASSFNQNRNQDLRTRKNRKFTFIKLRNFRVVEKKIVKFQTEAGADEYERMIDEIP